jgi:hypothetical protein
MPIIKAIYVGELIHLPDHATRFSQAFAQEYAEPLARGWLELQQATRRLGRPAYDDASATYSWPRQRMQARLLDGSFGLAIVCVAGILPEDRRKTDAVAAINQLNVLDGQDNNVIPFPGVHSRLMHRLAADTIGYYFHVEPFQGQESAALSACAYEGVVRSPYYAPTVDELESEFQAGDPSEVEGYYQAEVTQNLALYRELTKMLESAEPQDIRLMPPIPSSSGNA